MRQLRLIARADRWADLRPGNPDARFVIQHHDTLRYSTNMNGSNWSENPDEAFLFTQGEAASWARGMGSSYLNFYTVFVCADETDEQPEIDPPAPLKAKEYITLDQWRSSPPPWKDECFAIKTCLGYVHAGGVAGSAPALNQRCLHTWGNVNHLVTANQLPINGSLIIRMEGCPLFAPNSEVVLGEDLVRMIRQCPTDEVFRTMVLAKVCLPIPEELKGAEEILEWASWVGVVKRWPHRPAAAAGTPVEANLEPVVKVATAQEVANVGGLAAAIDESREAFEITFESSRVAVGRCSFRRRESGRGTVSWSIGEIVSLAENNDDWEDVTAAIRDDSRDNVEIEYEYDHDEPPGHDDYETRDYDDEDTSLQQSNTTIMTECRTALAQAGRQDLINKLDGIEEDEPAEEIEPLDANF